VKAAPRQPLEILELPLLRLETGDVDLVNLGIVTRVKPGHDLGPHINIVRELHKALIGNKPRHRVLDLNPPDKVLGAALVDKVDTGITIERAHPEKLIIDGNAPAAVAHHVRKTQLMHVVDGHRMRPARSDGNKMPRIAQLFERELGGLGNVLRARSSHGKRAVDIEEQVFTLAGTHMFSCIQH
jgi:hypothetical protein